MTTNVSLPSGYRLAAFETIGSTNDEAKRLAAEGAPAGTVVWARRQTQGRGRQDRTWMSPLGNLYCSILLRPGKSAAEIATLGFAAALAAAEAIEPVAPPTRAMLKWPNDVLMDGRKVAGILLESGGNGAKDGNWLVVGCGINLAHFPENVPFPAISLVAATGFQIAPEDALAGFCGQFDLWYRHWRAEGFAPVREAWLARAHPKGTKVNARLPAATITGAFEDIESDGTLILAADDGTLHRIAAGDVYFARSTATATPGQDKSP
jgi:BirA family biotin operon repressor/biotin-[acetyl-CoA-carboxylase] ligase